MGISIEGFIYNKTKLVDIIIEKISKEYNNENIKDEVIKILDYCGKSITQC